MPTRSGKRYKTSEVIHPGETRDAIPGIHRDIVVTHVLSRANMGPGDIARLRSVSRAMYDAVEARGRFRELEEMQDLYHKLADFTYARDVTEHNQREAVASANQSYAICVRNVRRVAE